MCLLSRRGCRRISNLIFFFVLRRHFVKVKWRMCDFGPQNDNFVFLPSCSLLHLKMNERKEKNWIKFCHLNEIVNSYYNFVFCFGNYFQFLVPSWFLVILRHQIAEFVLLPSRMLSPNSGSLSVELCFWDSPGARAGAVNLGQLCFKRNKNLI